MKQYLIGFIFLLFSSMSMAQNGKVGFVNVDAVISSMPEFTKAQNQLTAYAETLITPEMKTKGELIEQKYKAYQAEEATMGDARREVAQKEIINLETELQRLHQANQTNEKLSRKQQELFGPVEAAAAKLIEDVAKENGYTVVFDISASPVVYADQSANMMPLIQAKLGE